MAKKAATKRQNTGKKAATKRQSTGKEAATGQDAVEKRPDDDLFVYKGQRAQVVDVYARLLFRPGRYQYTARVTAILAWGVAAEGSGQVSKDKGFSVSEQDALGAPERVIEQFIKAADEARYELANTLRTHGVPFGALKLHISPDDAA